MSNAVENFDRWIRAEFVDLNTSLEELYFAQTDRADVSGVGDSLKASLLGQGLKLVSDLSQSERRWRTFEAAFDVLGNIGLFMAALRRHELTNPDRELVSPFESCSSLALEIGDAIGVAPRFVSAHLSTHNVAINGVQKSFTRLNDEKVFHDYNLYSILYYKRAADALQQIPSMGISASATALMLKEARAALNQVTLYNKKLFDQLDTDRFFFCIRPYFKSYRVGRDVYRGANAGDFAGVNQIDMILGLCRSDDPFYLRIIDEKMRYMQPHDQQMLQQCRCVTPLLDEFLAAAPGYSSATWFKENCGEFLAVCKAHGQTAAQHHNMLVRRFIEQPAGEVESRHLRQITASGPPLDVLLESLQKIRDLRTASHRDDMHTAHDDLRRLHELVE